MKTINKVMMVGALAISSQAIANEKIGYGFLNKSPSEIAALASSDPNEMTYSYDLRSSNEWNQNMVETSNLFNGFRSFETWNPKDNTNETIIYASEVAFIVQKNVNPQTFSQMANATFLSKVDPGFSHQNMTAEDANTIFRNEQASGKNSAIANLEGLSKKGALSEGEKNKWIAQVEKQHQQNIQAKWCSSEQSQCVRSSAIIPTLYRAVLKGASLAGVGVPESVDVYSELRSLSQDEVQNKGAIGGMVQVGFLSNKTLVSLKNTILAYALSDGTTLVTVSTLVVMEKDDLDKFSSLGSYDFVVGNSYLNSDEGLTMGLPLYAQKLAESLRDHL